jgi:hypothetical protein
LQIPEDDFYEQDPPNELQQGDVLVGVPLLLLPKSEELLLLRSRERKRLRELPVGQVEVIREKLLGDAFDEEEFVGVAAIRTGVVLMTQTCDLVRSEFWAVTPLQVLDVREVDRGNLYNGKYGALFPFPKHEHFEESLIDIKELHSIRPENVSMSNRIASLALPTQQLLSDRFLQSMGRRWGHAKDEVVPRDGKYRCLGCNNYDMPAQEVQFKKGEKFPDCGPCASIRRSAQWYLLQNPKQKQLASIK